MNLEHFVKIKDIIDESESSGLLMETIGLTGFSGKKLVGMLQRLAIYQKSIDAGCYLEVGVFQGLTLISVASVINRETVFGIDNFSHYDPQGKNQEIIQERTNANNLENVKLINMDYEDAFEGLKKFIGSEKIGTYFIDGPHDYRSQVMCLQLVKPHLSDRAVIVVDDCNYRHVRLANKDFLRTNPEFKMLFETYTTSHPGNMTLKENEKARKGWWNGVNVLVNDPENILDVMYPQTLRDRRLYENEHIVHPAKYGFLAPEAVYLCSFILSFKPIRALKMITRMVAKVRKSDREVIGTYFSMNTYSEKLPHNRFNIVLRMR